MTKKNTQSKKRTKASKRQTINAHAAGIDISASAENFVAVDPEKTDNCVRCFGHFTQALYDMADWLLVDFYHVCEYLAAASASCSEETKRWMTTQKELLKSGQVHQVIATLEASLEPEDVADENAPVRKAHLYLSKRKEQLNYDLAITKELPIGSGLIESAHKHVIQYRLKLPGAAWSIKNAEVMIQARAFRANGFWDSYWRKQRDLKTAA
jgi:hypothetical protein